MLEQEIQFEEYQEHNISDLDSILDTIAEFMKAEGHREPIEN